MYQLQSSRHYSLVGRLMAHHIAQQRDITVSNGHLCACDDAVDYDDDDATTSDCASVQKRGEAGVEYDEKEEEAKNG